MAVLTDWQPARPARLGTLDTLAVLTEVIAPTIAKGVLLRRPTVVWIAERLGLDARAVRRLQRLRQRHGAGPLILSKPGRVHVLVLAPEHVREVLEGTPAPYSPATWEKRAALGHFEPLGSLVSTGGERRERRALSESVLEPEAPVHSCAGGFLTKIDTEARRLVAFAGGRLRWDEFSRAWQRAVRRLTLGEAAADDRELSRMLDRLRARANWAFMARIDTQLRRRFQARLDAYVARAEPDSLAGLIAALPPGRHTAPADQIAHYLFAFDAASIATYRALALLAAHETAAARARAEADAATGTTAGALPFLRATLHESLRLWPTTPLILRETVRPTELGSAALSPGTNVMIFAPYLHRDRRTLPFADRFAPEIWLDGTAAGFALVPFSAGPGTCPAHHLVPMLGAAMLAGLYRRREVALTDARQLAPEAPMPGTLAHTSLQFELREPSRRRQNS